MDWEESDAGLAVGAPGGVRAALLLREGDADGILYVDGRRLREPYLPPHDSLGPPIPAATRQDPFRVPPGEFYVMGDNLAISCDSRFWGPIKGSSIIGRVVMFLWHDGRPDFRFF